jgi:hypothetical protein
MSYITTRYAVMTREVKRSSRKIKGKIIKMAVFWAVVPCRLVYVYCSFRGLYSLHRLHGATNQKTAIFTVTAVRNSRHKEKNILNNSDENSETHDSNVGLI